MTIAVPLFAMILRILGSLFRSVAFARRRLAADRRGGVAVFLALAIVPLMGFIGIGFDTARAYMVKSRLGSAVDAAGLAGGASFFLPTRDQDIAMFFDANFPQGYMNAVVDGPDIVVDEASEKIEISATATVATTFMRLLGHEYVTVYAEAEVVRQMKALDVVLSIDVSGSMSGAVAGGSTRINAAKEAANELIDILFGHDSTEDYLYIGLVPWNSKVNVMRSGVSFSAGATTTQAVASFTNPGTGLAQSVVYYANNSPVPLLSPPPSGWAGCVFNRYIHDGSDANDGDIRYGAFSGGGADWPGWQPVFPGADPNFGGEPISGPTNCALSVGGEECTRCPTSRITPLQNAKSTIQNAVGALSATGNTNIPAGLGWAWRVLKPEPPFTEAILDPDYDRDQAIVLMTDGENCGASGDGYKRVFGNCNGGRPAMNERLLKLADAIKADGVVIYVIQFAENSTELATLLKQVASGPESPYYHFAPGRDELRQVFREVANHLSMLRLSK
ncbi:MAG: pilus assembly protein TadG-related protein [Rhodospirillales bacterium]